MKIISFLINDYLINNFGSVAKIKGFIFLRARVTPLPGKVHEGFYTFL